MERKTGLTIASMVIFSLCAIAAAQQDKQAVMPELKLDPARVSEARQALDRTIKEAAKGADANFSQQDLALGHAVKAAMLAQNTGVRATAANRRKAIMSNRYDEVLAASIRIVTVFNKSGAPDFARADLDLLNAFRAAWLACNVAERIEAKNTKAASASLVASARNDAQRVLAEFNARGAAASFDDKDLRALQEFYELIANDGAASP